MKAKKIFIISLISSIILFTSCFNAVFYSIRQDVSPEESTVKGSINSICRYTTDGKEYLFLAAENGLRYKLASTGNERTNNSSSWMVHSDLPFTLHKYSYYGNKGSGHDGQSILKVLADKDTLYLVTVDFSQDMNEGVSAPDHIYIWAAKLVPAESGFTAEGGWQEIKFASDADTQRDQYFNYSYDSSKKVYFSNFNVFSTNAPKKEHRRVFVRTGKAQYFELSGFNSPEDISSTVSATDNTDTNEDIDSAAYIGNTLHFFDSLAVTTNETFEKDANYIYFSTSESYSRNDSNSQYEPGHFATNELKCMDSEGNITVVNSNVGEPISCLAVTKDVLLIGRGDFAISTTTYGGIVKVAIDSTGKPSGNLISFETNASIQLSTSYQILTILVADPAKTELESIIYSSITFQGGGDSAGTTFENIGLWAYYPDRGNWNCE